MKKTGILVLNIVEDFISKRKAKDQILIEKYKELQQPPSLELKTLLLLRIQQSLLLLRMKAKKKRKRLSPKNRRAIHNRLKALKLQVTPPCKLLMYKSILSIYLSENKVFSESRLFLKLLSMEAGFQKKIKKLFEKRSNLENELCKCHEIILEYIESQSRC